jgi:hypothetical protein
MVVAFAPDAGSRMNNRSSSALNSEQGLASIPMAQGGLSRLAIARLKSAGVPVAPILKRASLLSTKPSVIGAAQKGAGPKPTRRPHWVVSLVVGVLVAALIVVGMFLLLVSQKL